MFPECSPAQHGQHCKVIRNGSPKNETADQRVSASIGERRRRVSGDYYAAQAVVSGCHVPCWWI